MYGGVFLPWQDPSISLSVLVEILNQLSAGKLYFFGSKDRVDWGNTGIFESLMSELQKSPRVIAPGMVSHDELISKYTKAHVAIDLMKRNPERSLAFTSTVEYLWCGLPVIYNNYAELSDYIRDYNAGWIVDPEDKDAIAAVINEIFENPEILAQKSQNAQRLVREQFNWDSTIASIDKFVRHPSMRSRPLLHPPSLPAQIEKLPTAPAEIEKLQARITAMKSSKFWQLRKTWFQLKRAIGLGRNQVELVDQLQPQIQSDQIEFEQLSELIRAMETSKFWQLRKAWFQLKRTVGLGGNE